MNRIFILFSSSTSILILSSSLTINVLYIFIILFSFSFVKFFFISLSLAFFSFLLVSNIGALRFSSCLTVNSTSHFSRNNYFPIIFTSADH